MIFLQKVGFVNLRGLPSRLIYQQLKIILQVEHIFCETHFSFWSRTSQNLLKNKRAPFLQGFQSPRLEQQHQNGLFRCFWDIFNARKKHWSDEGKRTPDSVWSQFYIRNFPTISRSFKNFKRFQHETFCKQILSFWSETLTDPIIRVKAEWFGTGAIL